MKNKYIYLNILIYGLIVVLILLFSRDIMWAQKTLRGYLWSGNFDPPADIILLNEARIHLAPDGDLQYVQELLDKAIQIDPYSRANYYLGNCYAYQQKIDDALKCYENFRKIDPSFWRTYWSSIQLLKKKGDLDTLELLLSEGFDFYKKRVDLYQPQVDETIDQVFNNKAAETYLISAEVLKRLEDELEKVQTISNKDEKN